MITLILVFFGVPVLIALIIVGPNLTLFDEKKDEPWDY